MEKTRLRQKIDKHFNENELRDLCFELDIDYDALAGDQKSAKVRELVSYFERRGSLSELIQTCHNSRPQIFGKAVDNEKSIQSVFFVGKPSVGIATILRTLTKSRFVIRNNNLFPIVSTYQEGDRRWVYAPGVIRTNPEFATRLVEETSLLCLVIDGEPTGGELKLFNLLNLKVPNVTKIVFINKWDICERTMTREDQTKLKYTILGKMGKFVELEDIVYGFALQYNPETDLMEENIPQALQSLLNHKLDSSIGLE